MTKVTISKKNEPGTAWENGEKKKVFCRNRRPQRLLAI